MRWSVAGIHLDLEQSQTRYIDAPSLRSANPFTPYLRHESIIESIPGNKLPGYDHSSPSGTSGASSHQSLITTPRLTRWSSPHSHPPTALDACRNHTGPRSFAHNARWTENRY